MKKFIIFTLILLGPCHMHVAYCMKKKQNEKDRKPIHKVWKTKNDFIEKLKYRVLKTIKEEEDNNIVTAEFICDIEIDNSNGRYYISLLLSTASGKNFKLDTYIELPDPYLTKQIDLNPNYVYDQLYDEVDNIDTLKIFKIKSNKSKELS